MAKTHSPQARHDRGVPVGPRALLLAGFLSLGACALPDWADPIEIIGGRTPEPQRIKVDLPELRGPWPSLASVPAEAPRPSPQVERNRRQAALDSDNLAARGPAVEPPRAAGNRSEGTAASESQAAVPAPRPRRPDPRLAAPPDAEPPPPPPRALAPLTLFTTEATPLTAPPPTSPTAPRAAEPPGPQAQAPASGPRRDLVGIIYFDPGSAELDRAERRLLGQVIRLHRQRGGRIRVVGHAAGASEAASPGLLALSLERARAVGAGLRERGLGPGLMELAAAAGTAPRYDASAPTGLAGNRRVEIFLEY